MLSPYVSVNHVYTEICTLMSWRRGGGVHFNICKSKTTWKQLPATETKADRERAAKPKLQASLKNI